MEQDPIVRREVNSLQAMTNKRQETLQAGGDIDYIDSIIEKQNLRVQESAQKALTRLSTPNLRTEEPYYGEIHRLVNFRKWQKK